MITLTGDSYITSLTNTEVTNNSNIDLDGHTLYVNGTPITETDYVDPYGPDDPGDSDDTEQKELEIHNLTEDKVTCETWSDSITLISTEPCIVVALLNDEETYRVLKAEAAPGGRRQFSFDPAETIDIYVALKGDSDLNGIVNGNDVVEIKNMIRSGEVQNLDPLNELLFNLDGEAGVNGNDVVLMKNNIKGTEPFTW